MDPLLFIIELTKALAWPLLVFIAILFFRKSILSLFSNLNSIKAKDYYFEFKKDVNDMAPDVKINKDSKLVKELKLIIRHKPELACIEAWRKLEYAIDEKAKELNSKYQNDSYQFIRQIEYDRLIPSALLLGRLKRVRNDIIHTKTIKVTSRFAIDYIEYCESVIKEVNNLKILPKMKLHNLTYIILCINSLIDSNKYMFTIKEIEEQIAFRNVLQYIEDKTNKDSDLSLLLEPNDSVFIQTYYDELAAILGVYQGQARRKWGIENSGLCLLLSWTNEIVQRGTNWKEPERG